MRKRYEILKHMGVKNMKNMGSIGMGVSFLKEKERSVENPSRKKFAVDSQSVPGYNRDVKIGICLMSEVSELLEYFDDDWVRPPIEYIRAPELEQFKDMNLMLTGGVYILLLGIVIVYVGQAKCFSTRVGQHNGDKKLKFDGVKLFPCAHKGRRLAMEKALIVKYAPKYNVKDKYKPKADLDRLMAAKAKPNTNVVELVPVRRF